MHKCISDAYKKEKSTGFVTGMTDKEGTVTSFFAGGLKQDAGKRRYGR
jgi:hypothetical protein